MLFDLDRHGDKPADRTEIAGAFLIPAFILSELRAAFIIGFLIWVPFLLIDLIVSTVLASLGMLMMPPVVVSLPVKLALFVLVDGWACSPGRSCDRRAWAMNDVEIVHVLRMMCVDRCEGRRPDPGRDPRRRHRRQPDPDDHPDPGTSRGLRLEVLCCRTAVVGDGPVDAAGAVWFRADAVGACARRAVI